MGNVGSTSSRTGENSPRRSEMTAERVIVDPPFDVQADTASTVADLVSHTQLHCFNELNTVEPETIPPCHDKDQIPIKIELDKSPGTVQGERGEKEFRYLVSRPAECDRTKFRLFRKNLTELFDIGFDRSYSMHGTHRFVIHDEVVKIHNEIYSLMMACGVCSFEQISKLHEAAQVALDARQATLEALPELQACRRWIEQLGLYISQFEVQQDPDAAAPYVSTRDADDVLQYVWLLGKIEYFEADEILPLLRFVAREAQGETLDHRRALRDEVRNIADALERFGAHYTKKVTAIRNWMESEAFG
jgi:hypothetical protein